MDSIILGSMVTGDQDTMASTTHGMTLGAMAAMAAMEDGMAVGMVVGTIPGTMAMLVTTVGAGPIIVVGMAGAGTIPIGVVSTSITLVAILAD